eukprot:gnl/MRDRNA2_/MRDRNA2_35720_c0_seq1.p1 gnl/MRDRNA2_/MRDRNA2_35720_c0~~gnl/MRDRNA2_/MRDRNA2_35720_c0_seq1.p1  ORF type:complete len:230 (-),score=42.42 gnl/MRDRNA2_/MRDRNA2_35720_c0_seq1:82-771(-)
MQILNQVFGQCCACQDASEWHHLTATEGHTVNEAFLSNNNTMEREASFGSITAEHKERNPPGQDPKEEAERERQHNAQMHSLVMAFARAALQGVPCTLVMESGALCPATYLLDKHLRALIVRVDDMNPEFARECLLTQIQEIYCIEDGEEFFPPIISKLDEKDRQRLLLLQYRDKAKVQGPEDDSIVFLMSDRDTFHSCVKTLQMYAHSVESEDTQVSTPQSSLQAQAV